MSTQNTRYPFQQSSDHWLKFQGFCLCWVSPWYLKHSAKFPAVFDKSTLCRQFLHFCDECSKISTSFLSISKMIFCRPQMFLLNHVTLPGFAMATFLLLLAKKCRWSWICSFTHASHLENFRKVWTVLCMCECSYSSNPWISFKAVTYSVFLFFDFSLSLQSSSPCCRGLSGRFLRHGAPQTPAWSTPPLWRQSATMSSSATSVWLCCWVPGMETRLHREQHARKHNTDQTEVHTC